MNGPDSTPAPQTNAGPLIHPTSLLAPASPRKFTLPEAALLLLLALLTLLAFSHVGRCGFFIYDDPQLVSDNLRVQQGLSLANARWAFTVAPAGYWLPLTLLSLMLDSTLLGTGPAGYHWMNLALHVANALLLYAVFRMMTGSIWRSALIAALFAVHPLRAESVAWIAERKDVLAGFFAFIALVAYARYARTLSIRPYVAMLAAFVLSLMAKPMMMTLPFLLLLLDVWPLRRLRITGFMPVEQDAPAWPARKPKLIVLEKIPLLLLAIASAIAHYLAQKATGFINENAAPPLPLRLANAVISYARYMGKMVWFGNLAAFYPYPPSWPAWQVAAAAALLIAVTALALWRLSRNPWLAVGWFWFLGTLVPAIGLIQVGGQAMADRWSYYPCIGLLVMPVFSIPRSITASFAGRRALIALTIGLMATLTYFTIVQVGYWTDSVTMLEHTVAVTDRNVSAHTSLAMLLANGETRPRAIAHFQKAIELDPNYADAYLFLGRTQALGGDFTGAAANYRIYAQLRPESADAHRNLAVVLTQLRQFGPAIHEFQESLRRDEHSAAAHRDLGLTLAALGQIDQGLAHLRRAQELAPGDPVIRQKIETVENLKRQMGGG